MPKFVAPDLAIPENTQEGSTFEALAEVRLLKGGILELVALDGAAVQYPGKEMKESEPVQPAAEGASFMEAVENEMK